MAAFDLRHEFAGPYLARTTIEWAPLTTSMEVPDADQITDALTMESKIGELQDEIDKLKEDGEEKDEQIAELLAEVAPYRKRCSQCYSAHGGTVAGDWLLCERHGLRVEKVEKPKPEPKPQKPKPVRRLPRVP